MIAIWHRAAAAAVTALFAAVFAVAALAAPAKLTILHVNDVYEISPDRGHGGLAELMTLIKQERARGETTILSLGGDLISPSVMSGLSKGKQMVDLFNALGLGVAVYGNHEFDFGNEVLAERVAESDFPWLATNVLGADGKPAAGAQAYWTVKVGDYTLGFFGLLTPDTDVLSSPGPDITFKPALETAEQAVKDLKEQGADVIIAVTHLTIAKDREIAAKVGGINVILGGHEHVPISYYENGVLIVKSGTDAQYLGVVDLVIDTVEGRRGPRLVVYPQWRMASTRGVEPDPEIGKLVAAYEEALDKELDVPVGKTEVALDSVRANVRTKETTMGNLIADAIRAGVGADVGLTNGGGIRGDKVYEPGTTLTRKDVLSELPFGNVIVLVELSGADLKAALENGVSRVEDTAGRFPQVSGMSFTFDVSKPVGQRIDEVKIGGQALDPARMYTVATNDFMLGGGDGYASLGNGKVLIDSSAATLMATTVMNYIAAQGGVTTKLEGRITAK